MRNIRTFAVTGPLVALGAAAVLLAGVIGTGKSAEPALAQGAEGLLASSASPASVDTGGVFTATIALTPPNDGVSGVQFTLTLPSGFTANSCLPIAQCQVQNSTTVAFLDSFGGEVRTDPKNYTVNVTAGGSAGSFPLTIGGVSCVGADSVTAVTCNTSSGSVTVTVDEGPINTNTPTNTATATNTRTNTPTRTATATRTSTNTPSATSTAIIGGGGLTPTPTNTSAATVPVQTGTAVPTNPATATNTARPTDTALPTNTQAGMTNTPTATNTPSSTAVASGTAAVSATSGSGNTATPTRTGTAPLPPSTGTGSNFGGTSTVAALFLVAIGLGVSGFAATRVTRKR